MENSLDSLMAKKPGFILNSLFILIIRVISVIFGFLFIVIGLGLLLNSFFQFDLFKIIITLDVAQLEPGIQHQLERISMVLGVLFIFFGILMFFTRKLCNMVLRRNVFIAELTEWYDSLFNQPQKENQN